LWFEKKIKPHCRGEVYLVRFADDFVVSFQYRQDANQFQQKVRERFAGFGLEPAGERLAATSLDAPQPLHGCGTSWEGQRPLSFWI
jgi:hypothetical protein